MDTEWVPCHHIEEIIGSIDRKCFPGLPNLDIAYATSSPPSQDFRTLPLYYSLRQRHCITKSIYHCHGCLLNSDDYTPVMIMIILLWLLTTMTI